MKEVQTKKACEIVEDVPLYKLHLSFIEKNWLHEDHEKTNIESYSSENGCYFSCIFQSNADGMIGNMNVFIDPTATLSDVTDFANLIFRDEKMSHLQHSLFSLNLQSTYLQDVVNVLVSRLGGSHCEIKDWFEHWMVIAPTEVDPSLDYSLAPGYSFKPLDVDSHLKYMLPHWKADINMEGLDDTMFEGMMSANVSQRPSAAVFYEDEPCPAAWIQVYSDGSAGTLHVVDAHRRKRLARALMRRIRKDVMEVHGIPPHGCIKFGNQPSKNLCTSEGWVLQPVNYKRIFFNSKALEMIRPQ